MSRVERLYQRVQVEGLVGLVRLLSLYVQQLLVAIEAEQRLLLGQSILEHLPYCQRVVLLQVRIDQLTLIEPLQGEQMAGGGSCEEDGDDGGGALGEERGQVMEQVEGRRERRSVGGEVGGTVGG